MREQHPDFAIESTCIRGVRFWRRNSPNFLDEWMNHIFRASVARRSGQTFCRSFRNCSGIHLSQNEQFGVRQFIG